MYVAEDQEMNLPRQWKLMHLGPYFIGINFLPDQRVLPLDGKPGKQHQIRQAQAAQTPKSWISFVSRFRTQKRPKSHLQNLQGSKSGSRAWELCSLPSDIRLGCQAESFCLWIYRICNMANMANMANIVQIFPLSSFNSKSQPGVCG